MRAALLVGLGFIGLMGAVPAHAWTVRHTCTFLSGDQLTEIGNAAGDVLNAAWEVIPHAKSHAEELRSTLALTAVPDLVGAFGCIAFSDPAPGVQAKTPCPCPNCPDPREGLIKKFSK